MAPEAPAADPNAADPKPGDAPPINPETHDPESGKSWKEIAAEEKKKREQAEADHDEPEPKPKPANADDEVRKWRADMERKFSEDPIGAILQIAGMAANHTVRKTRQQISEEAKLFKKSKSSLRGKYKDFSKYESEFDRRVEESVDLSKATEDSLEMLFNAIRGEKIDAAPPARGSDNPPTKILGQPAPSGAAAPGSTGSGDAKLSATQEKDFVKSGISTREKYLVLLKQRQDRAKKLGVTQMPQTLTEPLEHPKT